MSLTDQIKADLLSARKEKDELKSGILRVLLGEVELIESRSGVKLPDDKIYTTIRAIIKANKISGGLEDEKGNPIFVNAQSTFFANALKLEDENKILEKYLPSLLSVEEIKAVITVHDLKEKVISASDKDLGKLTGEVMKVIKVAGNSANGNDIKIAMQELRGN